MSYSCGNCGAEFDEGTKFCPNCGTKINWETTNDNQDESKPGFVLVFVAICACVAVGIGIYDGNWIWDGILAVVAISASAFVINYAKEGNIPMKNAVTIAFFYRDWSSGVIC